MNIKANTKSQTIYFNCDAQKPKKTLDRSVKMLDELVTKISHYFFWLEV